MNCLHVPEWILLPVRLESIGTWHCYTISGISTQEIQTLGLQWFVNFKLPKASNGATFVV